MNNSKKAAPRINKKAILISVIAVILLAAIVVSTVFIVDYVNVDTPYDGVKFDDYVTVGNYIGVELSEAKVQEKMNEAIDGILDKFTEKKQVKTGKIEPGMNVTVAIYAYIDGKQIDDVSKKSYEIADIGNHQATEDQDFYNKLQEHVLAKNTMIDFTEGSLWDGRLPDFYYTYPEDHKVDVVKGKNVKHVLTITAVTTTHRPTLTDELVKNGAETIKTYLGLDSEFETAEELKAYLRHQIELNLVWNTIVASSEIKDYPAKFVQQQRDHYDSMYLDVMEKNGITTWEDFFKQSGITETAYLTKRDEQAKGIVSEELILYKIIKTEKIRMSGKEYKIRGEMLALEAGYEDLKDYENTIGKDLVERTVHWEIVKEYLLSKAVRVA